MRTYHGERRAEGCFVEVIMAKQDGSVTMRHPLDLALHLVNAFETVTGTPCFDWGGNPGCGGPQLALAILANCLGAAEAKEHYGAFKADVVCGLPHDDWTLTEEEIGRWHIKQHKAQLEGTR